MRRILFFTILVIVLLSGLPAFSQESPQNPDRIVGKWMTEKKNLIVEVYKHDHKYKAKIVWFDDTDDLSRPAEMRRDDQNPDPSLRKRKILGLEILKLLEYNQKTNSWEDGIIYDALTGKEWSSYAFITNKGLLRVKGYWHFKIFSKSVDFVPVK
ncbi:DUF2147 domain-containing protein [Pedobacter gandavensis]|uniref:DUF2147 domain-containing protein n=1 Tax=Pedobacter gandavensis TaxID=2679963 RepID=A0ABR6F267_9SPHI|nr:DUF2147 domain-containing protein [Pedobacter gandavensis]MBB2151623.1 DUF2147 domain-containing protein [Pedobacter gandavensis]